MSRRSRRKKAFHQPKEDRVSRWLARGMVGVLVLTVVGLILGYRAVRAYLRSDDFRLMLGDQAGSILGGEARFQPFAWDGWAFQTRAFEFESEEVLEFLEVSDIEASIDVGAVWNGVYRIQDVSIRKLELGGDLRGKKSASSGRKKKEEREALVEATEPAFWEKWLPSEVEVTALDIATIIVKMMTDEGEWKIENTSAKVRPGAGKGSADFTLSGGTVKSARTLFPEMKIRDVSGRSSGKQIYLLGSSIDVYQRGHLAMTGEYDFALGSWECRGELSGVEMEEVLPEDWRQRLRGSLEVDLRIAGKNDHDPVFSGKLSIQNGMLTAFPVLDRIAAYTKTERFRRLALSEAKMDFKKQGERIELREIILASEGLVRLEGDLIIHGEQIERGIFQLGITPGTLIHLPGAETKVFQRGKLGLLWAPIKVGGTLSQPTENLSDRLIDAAGERMFELLPETGDYALKYSGQKITDTTRELLKRKGIVLGSANRLIGEGKDLIEQGADAAQGVIDQGEDAAKEAVKTIFDIFGRPIPKEE